MTRGKVGPEAVFLFRNEIIHCSVEHGFHVLHKKKQTFKRFSVPAALTLIFAHAVPALMRFFAFVGVSSF